MTDNYKQPPGIPSRCLSCASADAADPRNRKIWRVAGSVYLPMPSMRHLAFEECGGPKGATPNIGLEFAGLQPAFGGAVLGRKLGRRDNATAREHMMAGRV